MILNKKFLERFIINFLPLIRTKSPKCIYSELLFNLFKFNKINKYIIYNKNKKYYNLILNLIIKYIINLNLFL